MRRRPASVDCRYTRRLFGRQIERLLADKQGRLSQNMLAEKLGKSSSTITGWKQGRNLPEERHNFQLLAKWLEWDEEDLLHRAQLDDLDYTVRKWGIDYDDAVFLLAELKTWEEDEDDGLRKIRAALALQPEDPGIWAAIRRKSLASGVPLSEYAAAIRQIDASFDPPPDTDEGAEHDDDSPAA